MKPIANSVQPAIIRGLYAITPDEPDTGRLVALVKAALLGGAGLVQYRNKLADADLRIEQSRALLKLCTQHQVPLIINDDPQLCREIDADGVHIGTDDGNLQEVRACLGTTKILGVSCYGDLNLAIEAQGLGADYVAFGACFPSGTKPNARKTELDIFTAGARVLSIPQVAIGGITLDNGAAVIHAGADAIAVIGALFSSSDVTETSRQFSSLFK